jgi:hypothetical protein
MSAKDILNVDHPLHRAFLAFLGDKEPTRRQARKFLQKYPSFKVAKAA